MNREIIHNQLSELLEAIQEEYEIIRANEGRIPQIEFDILLDNIRKFYEHLHLLQKVRAGHAPSLPSQPPLPVQTRHAPPLPSQPPLPVQTGHAPSLPAPDEPGHAPPLPPSPPPEIKAVERPRSAIRQEEAAEKKTKTADLDLFAGEEPTFNMKLREAREMSLPQKPEPVEHLKQLISINDKFIFMNELFDGNLKEYNDTVETLNRFTSKNEAFDYLDQLMKKNLWELESGTLMKLKEIVERYYP